MRETDTAFAAAHDRYLADYREGTAEAWCSNPRCENSTQPTTVGWASEYGQGWYVPEQCHCGSEWTEDAPEDRAVRCVSCRYPFDTDEERVETPAGPVCPDCHDEREEAR
jgi:hypothetical protein